MSSNPLNEQEVREQVKSEIVKVCDGLSEAALAGNVQRFVVITMEPQGGLQIVGRGGYVSDYIGMLEVGKELLKRQATA